MIKISTKAIQTVDGFIPLDDVILFEGEGIETRMKIFMPKINGRAFNYPDLILRLSEVLSSFVLSRSSLKKHVENQNFMLISQEARSKFRNHLVNKGELGELFLYTFLEGHLEAPQILSKMALKTATNDYVKGADGIHLLKKPDEDRYHLIFGEAKMYQNLTDGFRDAFNSISKFKTVSLSHEKSLISSQIDSEFENDDIKELIISIVYPSAVPSPAYSNAFGIFVGFEIEITPDKNRLSESDFEVWIKEEVLSKVNIRTIENQITSKELIGENFYVYLLPFTELDKKRAEILEELLK